MTFFSYFPHFLSSVLGQIDALFNLNNPWVFLIQHVLRPWILHFAFLHFLLILSPLAFLAGMTSSLCTRRNLSARCLQAEDDAGNYPSALLLPEQFSRVLAVASEQQMKEAQRDTHWVCGISMQLKCVFSFVLDMIQVCLLSSFSFFCVFGMLVTLNFYSISLSLVPLLVALFLLSVAVSSSFISVSSFSGHNQLRVFFSFPLSAIPLSPSILPNLFHSQVTTDFLFSLSGTFPIIQAPNSVMHTSPHSCLQHSAVAVQYLLPGFVPLSTSSSFPPCLYEL